MLVGAEFEENLSLRYLAAAVAQDGVGNGFSHSIAPRTLEFERVRDKKALCSSVPIYHSAKSQLAVKHYRV